MRSSSSWSRSELRIGRAWLPGIACLALVAVAGCASEDAASDGDVLISLTDAVVVPAYEAVARDVAQLDRDVTALCDSPGDSALEAARQSWRDARASWLASRAAWFGPVMDRRSVRLVDWSPTDVSRIDEMLSEGRVLSTDEVREVLASNLRGFGAIEYVLFGGGDLTGAPCAYLTGMTEVASSEADAVLSEWMDGTDRRPPYKDYFTDRAASSLITKSAVADVVRTQVFLIRTIVDMRLASALGLRGDAPDLTAIPGTAADNGLADLRNELLGMQAVYEGRGEDGLGVSHLVRPLSEETDERLRDQFEAAIAVIDAVEGPR